MPTWTRSVQSLSVGCFLIDAPMGLHGDAAWTLDQLVALIVLITNTFSPPYTIVIYSLYSMGEVQLALAAATDRSEKRGKLQLTKFIMVKVKHNFQTVSPNITCKMCS